MKSNKSTKQVPHKENQELPEFLSKIDKESKWKVDEIVDWLSGGNGKNLITDSSIYKQRRNLLILLAKIKTTLGKTDVGKCFLEDAMKLLRVDFGESFRKVYFLSKDEYEAKAKGVLHLINIHAEVDDLLKILVNQSGDQIGKDNIIQMISNLSDILYGLEKWYSSLKQVK